MNILKYLLAENINDSDESLDNHLDSEVKLDNIAENVFAAFTALTGNSSQVSSKGNHEHKLSLADSGIVFNDSLFVVDGLNVHLDTVH